MSSKASAGILLYRQSASGREVFLVHPGGPYYTTKDVGIWSIPKGQLNPGEEPLIAARREFAEEVGVGADLCVRPDTMWHELTPVVRPSGKPIYAWAIAGDIDPDKCFSNTMQLEWPPKSGQLQSFPEVDRYGWFSLDVARTKLTSAQVGFIDQLEKIIG